MGEKIASEVVTAIDDGTIVNQWGSTNIDDEGNPTQKTVLIENGILKSYIIDKMGARKMGLKSTGSGRRQSMINHSKCEIGFPIFMAFTSQPPLITVPNRYLTP